MDGEVNKLAVSIGEGDKVWGNGQDEVLSYQQKEEWLQKQLDFYTSRLNDLNKPDNTENNDNNDPQGMQIDNEDDEYRWAKTEEELLSKTADVHDTLYALSSRNLQNHLLIRRLTEQPTALRVLYETNTADPKEVQLKELMLTRDEKATKALALNDELKNLQNDRFDLEKSILEMKKSLRTKWSELRDKQQQFKERFKAQIPDQKNDANGIVRLEHEVQFLANQNKIVRNSFQALILASGVDWAEDPDLRDIFLNLSTEPEFETQIEALPFDK